MFGLGNFFLTPNMNNLDIQSKELYSHISSDYHHLTADAVLDSLNKYFINNSIGPLIFSKMIQLLGVQSNVISEQQFCRLFYAYANSGAQPYLALFYVMDRLRIQ